MDAAPLPPLPHVGDFMDMLAHQRRASTHTLAAYTRDLRRFAQWLAADFGYKKPTVENLQNLSPNEVRGYLYALHEEKLSTGTTNRTLSALRSYTRYLTRHHGLNNVNLLHIKGPRHKPPAPSALSLDDTEAVMASLSKRSTNGNWKGKRDLALMMTLYGLGLRISEALGLKIEDIATDTVRVVGKGKKERLVPLLPAVRVALAQWVEHHPCPREGGPLFIANRGGPLGPRYVQRLLENMRAELGLYSKLTPHVMRHCFATHLLQGGADLRVVQELLGHSHLSTTQRYLSADFTQLVKTHSERHPLEVDEFSNA